MNARGISKPSRTRPGVTVQPANALQKQVDRTKVSQQKVCIEVQRLLQRLRADHDKAAVVWPVSPDTLLDGCVKQASVFRARSDYGAELARAHLLSSQPGTA